MKNFYKPLLFLLIAFSTSLSAQTIKTLNASDDTYADGGKSSEILNDTQSEQMWVKTGSTAAFTRSGFIKFDITSLNLADVGTAKLRLYCYDTQSTNMIISAFSIEEAWSENTLTWDNQPAIITPAVRKQKVEENAYVEWQITRLVQDAIIANKTSISLGLTDENGDNKLARFYTKESSNPNKPQLYISDEIENYQALPTIDDAMVVGGTSANTNFGTDTGIQVKEGSADKLYVKKGLIKFDLNQIDANKVSTVGTARVKLYFTSANNATPNVDISLTGVENNWNEGTVTWNSFPTAIDNHNSIRTKEITTSAVGLNKYYEFDISAYVIDKLAASGDDGILSLAVLDLAGIKNGVTFNSKEAATFKPVLELLEEPTNVLPQNTANTGHFYVDAINGDDANNGNTTATAWKTLAKVNATTFGAGARVLFKKGDSWTGTLWFKGSGEAGNPIVIASYGEGAKPILNGAGAFETIHLDGNEYVEIRNLEITNYNPAEEGGISMEAWEEKNVTDWFNNPTAGYDLTSNTNKVGVRINAQDAGELNHIHLINLSIHGINGDNSNKNNGGIYMEITGSLIPTYYNDFLVEGCHIYDVDRTGMSNVSTWDDRTLTDDGNWTPTLNFVVRNNVFERSGANALILRNAKDPLIEYNLFHQSAIKGSGNAAFNFNTDGCVFQYNEARFTKGNVEDEDAGGLDSDFRTKNTTLQYNYVHDNAYGMLATGGGFNTSFNDNTIFRYNVVERDGLVARQNGEKFVFKLSGKITNTTFHNNVIYLSAEQEGVDLMFHKQWLGKPATTKYYNNIYYIDGSNHSFNIGASTGTSITNNVFYKKGTNISVPGGGQQITTDPMFVKVNAGPEGYKLKQNSPAINSGIEISGNTSVGYFGNSIPATGAIDRGFHQFSTENNSTTPGGFTKTEFDIYLLIGQSNMAGRGEIGALDQVPLNNAYLFDGSNNWEQAEAPLNKYSTIRKGIEHQKLNPGYTFARKLAAYTNRGIGLVVNARGGTKIELWEKGYNGSDDMNMYEEAVARLLEAKKSGVFKGIIWHQGESNQSSSSTYMAKLKKLVADLRADLGENPFFVAGEINKWRPESIPMNTVISSISNDINQASYIKSDDLAPINGDLSDPHFDTFSQRILGGLYADEILENVYGINPGVASVYSKCDHEGYKVSLNPGVYNLEELQKRGIIDNDIRSLKLDAGYEALLLTEENGTSELISATANCLTGTAVNENVSFVVIGETGTTGTMLSTEKVNKKYGNLIISPNPAKKNIRISYDSNLEISDNASVQIIDVQGRVINLNIKNSIQTNNTMEFDLHHLNLASGLYFVRLNTANYNFNKKLMID